MSVFKLPNFYAYGLAGLVGALIVIGIFRAGANYNEAGHKEAAVETNKVIVEDRGKDEAEIAAKKEADDQVDATVKANLKQTLILDKDTEVWLNLVK